MFHTKALKPNFGRSWSNFFKASSTLPTLLSGTIVMIAEARDGHAWLP